VAAAGIGGKPFNLFDPGFSNGDTGVESEFVVGVEGDMRAQLKIAIYVPGKHVARIFCDNSMGVGGGAIANYVVACDVASV